MPILIKGSGGRKAILQTKSITPRTYSTTYTPDDGYDGFSKVTVGGYTQTKPTGGDATEEDARKGKTFYSGGSLHTGTIEDVTLPLPSETHTFNDNNTLTVVSTYTPSKGYVSSTNKLITTKTLNIPTPGSGTYDCNYMTGDVSIDYSNSICYFGEIPFVSDKTLKYIMFTQSSSYADGDDDTITSMYIDCANNTAQVMYYNAYDRDRKNYTASYNSITSNSYVKFVIYSDHYMIEVKGYGRFSSYKYLAVYK